MKRMIRDKMIHSDFFCYNINIDFPFRAQNFNLRVGGFLVFSKKNKFSGVTTLPLRGEKYTYVEGLLCLFLFIKTVQIWNYPWVLKEKKVACRGVFVVSIWFCCKYQVGSGVIGYLYVYKLLFILKNGWC